jgi:2'-5' RNA ligase
LVDNGVRKHAAYDQAVRAINIATQTKLAVEAAGTLGTPGPSSTIITIPLPKKYAARFPDPVVHNNGHEPHLTLLTIGSTDYTEGELSEIIHRVRAAARTIPPFRVYVDPNSGLRDFGPSDHGEMALWLPARSEPRGELSRLHRMMRLSLEREGVSVQHKDGFTPHVTWAYVSNDIPEDTRRRLDGHVSDRFRDGFWFEVRDVVLSMPDGSTKHVALSPLPKKSVY